jgi:hypothetical protein
MNASESLSFKVSFLKDLWHLEDMQALLERLIF